MIPLSRSTCRAGLDDRAGEEMSEAKILRLGGVGEVARFQDYLWFHWH